MLLPHMSSNAGKRENTRITLYREIKTQGYTGSDRSVYRYLATLKQVEIQASVNIERIKKYTPNTAVWLFVRDPKTLNEIEQEDLATILLASPALKKANDLILFQGEDDMFM